MVFSSDTFTPNSILFKAKDWAYWFKSSHLWSANLHAQRPINPPQDNHVRNPTSFVFKPFPSSSFSGMSIVLLFVDGTWKAARAWSGVGVLACRPDGSLNVFSAS